MTEGLLIAGAFALGAGVQAIAGFGSALVAMPVLAIVLGPRHAAPLMALAGASVTVLVFWQNRQGMRWREALWLMTGCTLGVPLGAMGLRLLPEGPIVAALGVLLLGYVGFSLSRFRAGADPADPGSAEDPGPDTQPVRPDTPAPSWRSWRTRLTALAVGGCAGILGGAYTTDGPPLVIYGDLKRWPRESFRAILQACFFYDGFLILLSHGAFGLITGETLRGLLFALPGMAAGLAAGTLLDRYIPSRVFRGILLGLLMLLGLVLCGRGGYLMLRG